MSTWFFACDSDQHFSIQNNELTERKGDYITAYTTINQQTKLDFVLCPGDMTDHAADDFCLFTPITLECCKRGPYGNECATYMKEWIGGIEKLGISVYEGLGNHDLNKCYYPKITMMNCIHERHNATTNWMFNLYAGCYKFEHNGIYFICMGSYPKNLDWLRENLPEDRTRPIVFFYHYNTILGDGTINIYIWWTDKERAEFYDVIKEHNVKLIVNGHWHINKISSWNNIPVIICGGTTPVVIQVNGDVLTILTCNQD